MVLVRIRFLYPINRFLKYRSSLKKNPLFLFFFTKNSRSPLERRPYRMCRQQFISDRLYIL